MKLQSWRQQDFKLLARDYWIMLFIMPICSLIIIAALGERISSITTKLQVFFISVILFELLILLVIIINYFARKSMWFVNIKNNPDQYICQIKEILEKNYKVRLEDHTLLINYNNKYIIIAKSSDLDYKLSPEPHIIILFPSRLPRKIKDELLNKLDTIDSVVDRDIGHCCGPGQMSSPPFKYSRRESRGGDIKGASRQGRNIQLKEQASHDESRTSYSVDSKHEGNRSHEARR